MRGEHGPETWAALLHADHPRMRGEHANNTTSEAMSPGSPPHARGARVSAVYDFDQARITPACAGSTPGQVIPTRANPALRV